MAVLQDATKFSQAGESGLRHFVVTCPLFYKNFAKKYMEIHWKYMFFKVFPFFRFCFSLGGSTLFTKIDEVRQP